jgi:hypothetical protein
MISFPLPHTQVKSNLPSYARYSPAYSVWRRYNQFAGLHSALLKASCLPEMPSKNFFGQFDPLVLDERQRAFNAVSMKSQLYILLLSFIFCVSFISINLSHTLDHDDN